MQTENVEPSKLRKRSMSRPDFNEILLASIDEALSSLGENVAAAIYFHLENTFNIKREEIPQRISDFSDALEKLFGIGARTLEILCMEKLYSKVKVSYNWPEHEWPLCKWIVPEMTFQEHIRLMQQNYKNVHKGESTMGVLMSEHEELQK